jgi:FHS family Na+ dependent glucose MFS transporter 1
MSAKHPGPVSLSVHYCSTFIYIGLGIGAMGPSIARFADQASVAVGDMGLFLLIGSIGFTIGTALSGRVFDKLPAHPVIAFCLMASALIAASFPLISSFVLLVALNFIKGLIDSMVATSPNTLLSWLHRDKAGPYINALHFSFGLGAFAAPFLVGLLSGGGAPGYRTVFWILAGYAFILGLRFLSLGPSPTRPEPTREASGSAGRVPWAIVIAAAFFLFFYVGAELCFGNWAHTYAVARGMSDSSAAFLSSLFWACFTLGRLLSIPAARAFAPAPTLALGLGGSMLACSLPMLMPGSEPALWVCAAAMGFFMAPIWPSGFNLAGRSLALTATISSVILLGDSVGGLVLPTATGKIIEWSGSPGVMFYLVMGSLALCAASFLLILRGAKAARRNMAG